MIVVVTGPSAAGKTTWCRRHHADHLVPEDAAVVDEAAGADDQAAYWCEVNCRRWQAATERERASGLAVCDDDPMKLHYTWSLLRIGEADPAAWERELVANRAAIASGRLGFADLVLVSLPPAGELRARRDADRTRRRRNFELHARLAEPLREWYQAWERVSPGRVRWSLPPDGLPAGRPAPRAGRYDPATLDALVAALPPVSRSGCGGG
ncbi:hypothetical protein Aab01nite_07810 [Paractinoplanes abujensis]|uniref:Uncharacterized protein n=1 Tax=Paractinoplanes abujensis TaxID=882441 RepID=A0A7W7CMR0_9ACTN|nr:hypothetical protein [Actinoplanes abujensis]MBB4691396.1 hypothetical protein [Actinoplanes abujensis]GID17191.1 hypothetical protein Aab01nite_07810 [Actinoplanes abujensis]